MYTLSRDFYYFILETIFVKLRYNTNFIRLVAHPTVDGYSADLKKLLLKRVYQITN